MFYLRLYLSLFIFAHLTFATSYDAEILQDHPVLYLPLSASSSKLRERDLSKKRHRAYYFASNKPILKTRMPNGDRATVFDGYSQYLEVPSDKTLSLKLNGALTLEAWIRPDTLEFPSQESEGYIQWAGKGETGEYEYACRMYSFTNTASPARPNRISGYIFNRAGGLGSGSYFQDPIQVHAWIHVAVIIDSTKVPAVISIFKNGVLRKTTLLSQFNVIPEAGNAPLRIATRDGQSYFKGAIGKFALYPYALSDTRLKIHFHKMQSNF